MTLPNKIPDDELDIVIKEWRLLGNDVAEFPCNDGLEHSINFFEHGAYNYWYVQVGGCWELDLIETRSGGRWHLEWQGSHD